MEVWRMECTKCKIVEMYVKSVKPAENKMELMCKKCGYTEEQNMPNSNQS